MIRANIFFALITMAAWASLPPEASAQSPEALIEACSTESDLTERVACLERALRAQAADNPSVPTSVPPAIDQAEIAATSVAPETSAPVELGADQIAAREQRANNVKIDNNRQSFEVVSSREVPYKKLEVTLANGQVWRQIKGDSRVIRVPKRFEESMTVEIWNARFSGYKMYLKDLRKTIRVERLK